MEDNRLYFITSIYLNAFLLSKDFKVEKTSVLDSGKVALFYADTEELHRAIEDYKNNKELTDFVTSYLKVKDIIRLHKQSNNKEDVFIKAITE